MEDRGRRDRNKRRTRAGIEKAALRLFAERGYERTTIEDIAAAADVARRTFFHYFASKEQVLLGDLPQRRERLRGELELWLGRLEPLAAVQRALVTAAVADDGDRERLFLRARLLEEAPALMARNLGQYAAFEDTIAAAVGQHLGVDGSTDPYPRLVGACAMAAVRIAVSTWYRRGADLELDPLIAETFGWLATGLPAPTTPRGGRRDTRVPPRPADQPLALQPLAGQGRQHQPRSLPIPASRA